MEIDIRRWRGFLIAVSISMALLLGYSALPYAIGQSSRVYDTDGGDGCCVCCGGIFGGLFAMIFGSIFFMIIFFVVVIGLSLLIIWGIVKFILWIVKKDKS